MGIDGECWFWCYLDVFEEEYLVYVYKDVF